MVYSKREIHNLYIKALTYIKEDKDLPEDLKNTLRQLGLLHIFTKEKED